MTETNTKASLLGAALSKWPLMFVWGTSVTQEQAKDIILKTVKFFHDPNKHAGGNNHQWNAWAREQLGMGPIERRIEELSQKVGWAEANERMYDVKERFCTLLGAVPLSYVTNDWASSIYILGPNGWAHPDGTIQFSDAIGKYPEVSEVLQDWTNLAQAFPYLDLTATLVNEDIEGQPAQFVVSFRVQGGSCELMEPVSPPEAAPSRDHASAVQRWADGGRHEQGLPDAWITEFGALTAPLWEQAWQETEAPVAATAASLPQD